MKTIVIANRRAAPTGCVRLVKVDCCNRARRLAGARFDLLVLDPVCGTYRPHTRGLETDRRGVLEVAGLAPGRYRFVERRAPQGYRIAGDGRSDFELCAGGEAGCRILVVGNCRICPPRRRCCRHCC